MRLWKRHEKMNAPRTAELTTAMEAARASRRQAREDLRRQKELLAHEDRTITSPLRSERVEVNHFSALVRGALRASYEEHHRGELA